MEPAPTGGPSAAPDVPPGTPYGHEGAAEGRDERAVGDQTDRALNEAPMAPQDTVTPDPLPIVANGVPIMGDSKGSASFARTGYPDESTFAPRAPLSQNGPFSSDGPFSPLGPFSDNPAPGDFAFPAGTGLSLGDSLGSEVSPESGFDTPHHNGSGNGQPAPPTGRPIDNQPPPPGGDVAQWMPPTSAPVADQPPPPTGQPVAQQPVDQRQLDEASSQVYVSPPAPSGSTLSVLPPPPSGALVSKLPPPPSGASVRMPPSAGVEPAPPISTGVDSARAKTVSVEPAPASAAFVYSAPAESRPPRTEPAPPHSVAPVSAISTFGDPLAPVTAAPPVAAAAPITAAPTVAAPPVASLTPITASVAPQSTAAVPARPDYTFSPQGSIVHSVPEQMTGLEQATRLDDAIQLGQALVANLRHVVLGTPGAITAVAVAALCGGHLLIEDVPGVGKTVLAQALAASLGTDLSRIQGHPDLLPSDVTGVSVFSPDTGTWEFKPGPVFAHVVLVDELNRTPPRTQAALLETMEEQQVSADGESWRLPIPHLVIATQNPHSQLGTYPLVESQLDRFALATAIGYPDADVETQIVLQHGGRPALPDLRPVCTPEQWLAAQLATQTVVVEEAVAAYAVALCRGSRSVAGVRLGASPRAAIWLVRTAQAHAVLAGRAYVTPGDVKAMALSCLSHRLTTDEGVAFGVKVVRALLESTPAPRP